MTYQPSKRGSSLRWAGFTAFVLGIISATISLYWTLGGTLGLDTIGGEIEEAGRARNPTLIALVAAVTVIKAAAALFALALVCRWGRMFPRRLMIVLGWFGAVVLALYGGVLVGVEALVEIGVIKPQGPVDWKALRWHLYLWDPYFLIWGILLGLAVVHYSRVTGGCRSGRGELGAR
jgi:hypothetical protein